ncbi:MAG: hypothetical protein HGA45_29515 [Chloroflexales bacterium]|nr:hypothetical protein [Chloroflexales bacterium]
MPAELDRFISAIRRGGLFAEGRPITVARAPGWVDLMGGAAAPGGALALGWPLGSGSFVAVQPTDGSALLLHDEMGDGPPLPLSDLVYDDGSPREYADVAARLGSLSPWHIIVGGAWLALMREEFARFPGGARLLVRLAEAPGTEVGLAAAVAQALVSAYKIHLAPRELGLAVRTALARVAGWDPGALGPLVSTCAHSGGLLPVHQQPAWLWGEMHLPPGTAIWAVRLGDGPGREPAAALRAATAIAWACAAEAAGLSPAEAGAHWLGYLANLGTPFFEARVRGRLPDTMLGAAALDRFGPPARAMVEPGRAYPVRAAAALAVEEHLRARMAAALLRAAASKAQRDEDLHLVGEIMARSHGGQRAAGLGDPRADELVEQIYAEGAARGIYGARAAAAESGVTLVVLGRAEAEPALRAIAQDYERAARLPVAVFGGSSAGASAAGTREI